MYTDDITPKYSIIVLLYNKSLNESETIAALLKQKVLLKNSNLCIWNNGPKSISISNDISNMTVGFVFRETLCNESLSRIYNEFIDLFDSEYYIFLDDDSFIGDMYVNDVLQLVDEELITPIVTSGGNIISPSYMMKDGKEKNKSRRAIASGLIIHQRLLTKIKKSYGDYFDERFYFYGVDTSFIYRVNRLKIPNVEINGFSHRVSEHEIESNIREQFKRQELSYSLGLKLRYYPHYELYKYLLMQVMKTISFRKTKISIIHTIKAFIIKNHPRNVK